jgi:hypothetical protein
MFYVVVLSVLKKLLFLLLFSVVFLPAKEKRSIPLSTLFQTEFSIKEKTFQVWLAIDPKQKSEGLSLLLPDEVASNQGMLFLYPYEEKLSFWMKNTYFDLDIAYIKSSGEISDIATMKKMKENVFSSSEKVRYVLELKAGSFKRVGLKVGDKISIPQKIKVFL